MSYASSQASVSITVEEKMIANPDLKIENLTYPSTAKPGEAVKVSWYVHNAGGNPDYVQWIRLIDVDTGETLYSGYVSLNNCERAGPAEFNGVMPNRNWRLKVEEGYGTTITSTAQFQIALPAPPPAPIQTSLTIEAPKSVVVNESFTVSGKLTRVDTGEGIPNQPINIYYDTSKIASTTTTSNGTYSTSCAIPKPGTFTLKAEFPSVAGSLYATSSAQVLAKVTGPLGLWGFPIITALRAFFQRFLTKK